MRATGLDLTPLTAIALKNLQSPYIPRERADSPETVRSIFTPLFLPRNIRAIYAQLLQQDDMEE